MATLLILLFFCIGAAYIVRKVIKHNESKFNNRAADSRSWQFHDEGHTEENYETLFKDAVELILKRKEVSQSILQRNLGIGYSMASKLIARMEELGIVGSNRDPYPREILIDKNTWLKGTYNFKGGNPNYKPTKSEFDTFDFEESNDSEEFQPAQKSGAHSYYEVLGISEKASIEEIKEAYRKKMLEYHPDRTGGLGDKLKDVATEESKRINHAYDEIMKERSLNGNL